MPHALKKKGFTAEIPIKKPEALTYSISFLSN
jgi:hypothetical protein